MTTTDVVPGQWHGLWRSVGYNRILEVTATGYTVYTVTASHASPVERGSASEFAQAFDRLDIDAGGRLTLFHAHDITRYQFTRLEGWPPGCRLHASPCHDPLPNHESFCELFAENYAFFDLRGADWPALCAAGRARLDNGSSTAALLDVFEQMITPLADMHVYVSTPARKLRSAQAARGPRPALQATFGLPAPQLSLHSSIEHIAARLRQTLLVDFAATLTGFRQAGNAVVAWGSLCPGVGYLNLLRMFGFAATEAHRRADDLPHRLCEAGPFLADDMSSLEQILDAAMTDLGRHDALIVDVRLNGGGFDRAGMVLCERLTDVPRTAFRKSARCGDGFTASQSITIAPSGRPGFTRPVFLLTSPFTLSAGEVFALAMSSLPNVTILGERTQGILSDNLFHRLPCGWEVSLSNEIYETPDGRCHEAVGVPPDIALPSLSESGFLSELRAGLRLAADRASGR